MAFLQPPQGTNSVISASLRVSRENSNWFGMALLLGLTLYPPSPQLLGFPPRKGEPGPGISFQDLQTQMPVGRGGGLGTQRKDSGEEKGRFQYSENIMA